MAVPAGFTGLSRPQPPVAAAALSGTQLSRTEPSRLVGRLFASQPPRHQWEGPHQETIGPARENHCVSALEPGQRFACTLRGADPKELRRCAYHAAFGPSHLVEFAVDRTRTNLCHHYTGARKIGPQRLTEPCDEKLTSHIGGRARHHGEPRT